MPALDDVLALEEHALNAWPASRTVAVGGWALRLSDGYTKRANSANALSPSSPFDKVREAAERLYRDEGLPPIFRITPLAGADADVQLDRAGYQLIEPSLVMTAAVDAVADVAAGEIADAPSSEWLDGYARASGLAEGMREKHAAILGRIHAPAAFVTLRRDDETAGCGLAVYAREVVGLFDIVVSPSLRGRGYGRALTGELMNWARRKGARSAYLQVHRSNAPALSLYNHLGFAEAYGYHYRIPARAI